MQLITLVTAIFLSFFSTAIMSYISMATGIGPWIETTLVLFGMLLFSVVHRWYSSSARSRAVGLVAAMGGIGGILAVACGFTFPTYYFLDPQGFSQLLSTPSRFAALVSLVSLAAGSVGLVTAHYFERSLLDRQALAFPIGELVYKMIGAADSFAKAVQLAGGFIGTQLFLMIRTLTEYLSRPLVVLTSSQIGIFTVPRVVLPIDQLPMFWAIGFVTGHVIAVPLLVGLLVRLFIINPLHTVYPPLHEFFFGSLQGAEYAPKVLSRMDFTIAFCSGLVLYGAAKGFLGLPKVLRSTYDKLFKDKTEESEKNNNVQHPYFWYASAAVLIGNILILSYLSFSWMAQIYLILFTLVCTYQLMLLAGKFGLAPLGRFATFVMVPGMLMFGFDAVQTTMVALYVEVAGGVASDALFGRKMARLASIDKLSIVGYQWLGLVVSTAVVGAIMWVFINHFGLGQEVGALAVTRAASRAFLISVKSFDVGVLLIGLMFGYLISFFRISPALLLGGILMQISYTLMLVLGGLSTYLVEDKEEYYPFWSGVFAANSLWMLLRAFI